MLDLVTALESATVEQIEMRKLKFPVTAEVSDLSAVPYLRVTAVAKDQDLGFYSFRVEELPGTTLWKQGPHTIKIEAPQIAPFSIDFRWPQ